jgi:branched-chain amino acid transport system permease protein
LAIIFTLLVMILFAFLVEKYILKHLVNQEPIILFMATIGLAYFMEGFGDLMWGADIKKLDVGLPQGGNIWLEENTAFLGGDDFYGFYLDNLDMWATFVAGIMWGSKSGVQFSLSLIALKALPVLMLGGFTSIPGAIIGGLIIGVGEKMFEFLIGAPFLGGATENWFAYMLALIFLVFRPQGLFGEKIIERV